jgi:P pilus assembly chaperone PapD
MFPLHRDLEPRAQLNESEGFALHRFDPVLRGVRSLMLRYLLPAIAALLVAEPVMAQVGADLNISPKRVVFGPGERSATVYVFNQGDQPATYAVELVDRVMTTDGRIVAADEEPGAQIDSARDLVQFTPRRISLPPRTSQAIRVRARPGGSGEHRTHLTVTALPPENAGFTVDQAAAGAADEVSLQVVALFSVSIPVIVRDGSVDARAAIDRVSFRQEDSQGLLSLDLVRTGANSVYGDVEVFADTSAGQVLLTAVRGVAVYPEVDRRTVVIPLPRPPVAGEPLTIIYRDDDAGRGEVLATATLVAP